MNKLFPLVVFLTFPILCFGCDKDNEIKYMNTKSHLALPVEDIEKARNFYVDVFRVPVNEGTTPEGNPVYALEIGPIIISFNQLPKVEMSEVNSIPNDILKLNKIRDTYFVSSQHWGLYNLTKNEFDGIIQRLKKMKPDL
ncbi:VOC family protein [Candidatus Paracaedibacter symbiosus]|uniref:VOC family protein n=1 Tax=Candidatus Paracaedibacter symbiosus TaxID=244582 RepID=UPI0005097E01|nr:VOC family protein [Candidatus Paracaedibacter symbiosus]